MEFVTLKPSTRFLVGFISAQLFPVVKLAQNGAVSHFNMMVLVGACVPPILLGTVIGIYAIIVESKENDVGRLFRVCVSLPALIINLSVANQSATSYGAATAATMAASPSPVVVPEGKELTCTPKDSIEVGLQTAVGAMANDTPPNWWVLAEKGDKTRNWITIDGKKWYIVGKSKEIPTDGTVLYDCIKCRLIIKPQQ
jgi:hypothetical protein